MAQKKILNVVLQDPADDALLKATVKAPPVHVEQGERAETCDMTIAHAVRDFCKLIFLVKKDVTWNYHSDLKTTDRVLRACRIAVAKTRDLELDQADFDWLTKKIEEYGANIFGSNTNAVREALVEVKAEEPAKTEPAKAGA